MASSQSQHRCVFVGNIPYDTSEEQLIEICKEVGPVVSFRLVIDRETGKPKGYGFCEYKDEETALSARRNLQGYEINGRQLRVDFAENDKGTDKTREQGRGGPGLAANIAPLKHIGGPMSGEAVLHQPIGLHAAITGATVMAGALGGAQASLTSNQNGVQNQSALVSDPLTLHLAKMSRSQLNGIMSELKMMGAQNKELARQLLLGRPQLAKALFQAQIMLGMVNPQVLQMPNIRQAPAHTSQPVFQDSDQNPQATLPGLPPIAQTRMQSGFFPQVHQGQASVASQIAVGHNQFSVSPQLPVQPRVHLSQHSTNQVLEQATLPEQYGASNASVQAHSTASLAPRPQIQTTMSSSLNQQMQPSLAQQRTTPIGTANLGQATRMPFPNANMQHSPPVSSSIPETIYRAADKSTLVTDDARANLLLRNNTHSKRPMTVAGKTNLVNSSSELIGRPSKLPKLNDGRSTTFLANGNVQPQVSGPTNPDPRAEDMQYTKNKISQPQLPSDMESALLQQVMNLSAEQLSSLPPEQQQQVIQLQQMLRRDQVQPL